MIIEHKRLRRHVVIFWNQIERCRSALLTMPWSYHCLQYYVLICTLLRLLPVSPNNRGQRFSKRENCVDAQSHSSEAATLKPWKRGGTEWHPYTLCSSSKFQMLRCRSALLTMPWSYHCLQDYVLICTLLRLLPVFPNNMGQSFPKERIASMLNRIPPKQLHSNHESAQELNDTHIPCVCSHDKLKKRRLRRQAFMHLRNFRCWDAGLHYSQCLDHITACKNTY